MIRTILTPAALSDAALAGLKQWLGITVTQDDTALTALLRTSLEICEAFTGLLPIEAECEEVLPAATGWQKLATRPVRSITRVIVLSPEGERVDLPAEAWTAEIDADGTGRVRLTGTSPSSCIAVRYTAGLAPDWGALPDALRHGAIRLAAHQHRERETSGAAPLPPASVAALWRPWRRMTLA